MELHEKQDFLNDMANLEDTECGEYWKCLADMCGNTWQMNDDFQDAFLKEVDDTIELIKTEYKLVEENREVTRQMFVRELVWTGGSDNPPM